MPWETRCQVEQRVEFVTRALSGEESIKCLCEEYGISRVTGYKWIDRYRRGGGVASLRDKSRRPHRSPFKTAESVERQIGELYKEYGWGPKKTRKLLSNKGINIPLITVRRVYARNGYNELRNVVGPALKRFERSRPNELLQMDHKGQFMTNEGKWCYPLSLLDDHSRYCVGLHAVEDQSISTTEVCLIKTFEEYGIPEGMLMDHGIPWWSTSNLWGLTRLSVWLIKQGIKISFSRVRHPQTQGKVERFHRTLKRELHRNDRRLTSIKACAELFEEFRYTYNEIRPHESLNLNPPVSRYTRSRKEYSPRIQHWDYPEGSTVMQVDSLGRLSYENKRFFVCEALVNEQVRIVPLEYSALVIFRNMVIRELDLDTGSSKPTVFPVTENFAPWG